MPRGGGVGHEIDKCITSDGRPHLGAPVGTTEYVEKFTMDKIDCWISEIDKLSSVTISQPHAAYTSFTHGLISRWLYVSFLTFHLLSTNLRRHC